MIISHPVIYKSPCESGCNNSCFLHHKFAKRSQAFVSRQLINFLTSAQFVALFVSARAAAEQVEREAGRTKSGAIQSVHSRGRDAAPHSLLEPEVSLAVITLHFTSVGKLTFITKYSRFS